MSMPEQVLLVVRRLSADNVCLQSKLWRVERECRELRCANANLQVERDSTDVLLGEAMDCLLEKRAQ